VKSLFGAGEVTFFRCLFSWSAKSLFRWRVLVTFPSAGLFWAPVTSHF